MSPASRGFEYDWLVIGSSFGGSVSALRRCRRRFRSACSSRAGSSRTRTTPRRPGSCTALDVSAVPRPARHLQPERRSGRLHLAKRCGGRQRQHRLRQLPSTVRAGSSPTRRWRDLNDWAAASATMTPPSACFRRCRRCRATANGQKLLREMGRGVRRRGHVPSYAGRRVLRQAGHDRARPGPSVVRPGTHRLHVLRRVHGRLPRRRQEHTAQEPAGSPRSA